MSPEQPTDQKIAEQASRRPSERSWHDALARALFEIMIVAVGVMLALAVDEWREKSEQRQLADEARATLRAEILANRQAVISKMRRVSQLYLLSEAHPDRVGEYVLERRNRTLLLNNSAWTMAVETGALRWLSPEERSNVAEIYAGHQRVGEVVMQEMTTWAELAAFESGPASPEVQDSRDRAIRVWQAFALRLQLAQCVTAGRYERALGARIPVEDLIGNFCAGIGPDEDPAIIYREWKKRGWTSPVAPRL